MNLSAWALRHRALTAVPDPGHRGGRARGPTCSWDRAEDPRSPSSRWWCSWTGPAPRPSRWRGCDRPHRAQAGGAAVARLRGQLRCSRAMRYDHCQPARRHPARAVSRSLVPGAQEGRRHRRRRCRRRAGPVLQRRVRRHLRHRLCLHRGRFPLAAAAPCRRGRAARAAARSRRRQDHIIGDQDERIYIELLTRKLAELGLDPRRSSSTLARENASCRRAFSTTSRGSDVCAHRRRVRLRGGAAGNRRSRPTGGASALGDIATVQPRHHRSAGCDRCAVDGEPALGTRHLHGARAATSSRSGTGRRRAWQAIAPTLPLGVEVCRSTTSRRSWPGRRSTSSRSSFRGAGHRAAGELPAPGLAHRAGGGDQRAAGAGGHLLAMKLSASTCSASRWAR